jgi:hypothetical protein
MTIGLHDDKGAHFYRCDFQVHTLSMAMRKSPLVAR